MENLAKPGKGIKERIARQSQGKERKVYLAKPKKDTVTWVKTGKRKGETNLENNKIKNINI